MIAQFNCLQVYYSCTNNLTPLGGNEMKQRFTKLFAILLAVTMLATVSSLFSFAAEKSKKKKLNYLVIGDSISAGYGMHLVNGSPDDLGNQFTLHHGELVEGTYPKLVSEALGASTTVNTSRESFTAANYLRMIDPEFDAELARPENYYERYLAEITAFFPKAFGGVSDLQTLKDNMVRYIEEADVITIGLGNNDTFTTALLSPIFRTLYYTYGMGVQVPLTALKGQFNAITSIDQLVEMAGGYNDIFAELARRVAIYEKNYDRLVQDIVAINPDVEIYYVGMYNTFADVQPADNSTVTKFRNEGQALSNELKNYVTKSSKYKNRVHYVDVGHVEVWPSAPVTDISFYTAFLIHVHPDYTGHKQIANKIIKSMKKYGTI